jgi:putative PIN family toxin of toxin-antitoxin system
VLRWLAPRHERAGSPPSSRAALAATLWNTPSASTVVISSLPLLNELRDVLAKKFRQRSIDVRGSLRLFAETFTLVVPGVLDRPVCRDHDDDLVLAAALAGDCAAILTGDQDLLILDAFSGIRVLAPSAFWKWESECAQA